MPLIVLADGLCHLMEPRPRDIRRFAPRGIEVNVLDVTQPLYLRRMSPLTRRPFRCCGERLVHNVVGEYSWVARTLPSDGFPELSLRGPMLLLRRVAVPGGNVGCPVSSQTGYVKVQAKVLGQRGHFPNPRQIVSDRNT